MKKIVSFQIVVNEIGVREIYALDEAGNFWYTKIEGVESTTRSKLKWQKANDIATPGDVV